jgi:cell division protein FtsZ
MTVVHNTHQTMQRTGTDNLPVLNQAVHTPTGMPGVGHTTHHASTGTQDYAGLNTPSVWRTRAGATSKVEALANTGMDEIEIPAFLRRQAD